MINTVDTAFGKDSTASKLTVTAHTLLPRDHQSAKEIVLQVQMNNAALHKTSVARVCVLSDGLEWTTLLDLAPTEWLRQVNPTTREADVMSAMTALADDLLRRAITILGA